MKKVLSLLLVGLIISSFVFADTITIKNKGSRAISPDDCVNCIDFKGNKYEKPKNKKEALSLFGSSYTLYREIPGKIKEIRFKDSNGDIVSHGGPGKNEEVWLYKFPSKNKNTTILFITIDTNTGKIVSSTQYDSF